MQFVSLYSQNRTKSKRENYGVEIRNQSRQSIFQQKRNQFVAQQTQYKFVPNNFFEGIQDLESFVKDQLLNPNNSIPYVLEALKIINEKKKIKVYRILQAKLLDLVNPFVGVLSQQDDYLSYLAFYHLLNIIYYFDQSQTLLFFNLNGFKDIYLYIKEATYEFIRKEKFEVAAFGLFTLANILSETNLSNKHPFLNQTYRQTLNELLSLQKSLSSVPTINYIHGLLWMIRNLTQLNSNVFDQHLDILQLLIEQIDKHQRTDDIGFQITQDFLQILSVITRNMTEEEISSLFATHIQLMIFVVSNHWNPKVHLELAEVFRNLLYGQDDVIDQLMQLGIQEVLSQLLQSQNTDVIEEAIGCLRNIFGAEDEEIITNFLGHNDIAVLKDLLDKTQPGNKLEIRNEAVGAIQTILTSYQESAEIIIKLNGIGQLICSLNEAFGLAELINNILSSIYQLLQYDFNLNQEQVRQFVINCGGEQIISKFLDSDHELTKALAYKLIDFINLE